jgi:hypothetical protein
MKLLYITKYFMSTRFISIPQHLQKQLCHPERSEGPMQFAVSVTAAAGIA